MAQTDRLTGLVGNAAVKVPCRVATTAAITLAGHQTIDGVLVITGERVLVKDQGDAEDNGIYVVDSGTWSRAKDCDGPYDLVKGSLVKVNAGATGQGFYYADATDPITIGTSEITWAPASTVLAVISGFIQSLFDDADAATARTTLGAVGLTGNESVAGDKTFSAAVAFSAAVGMGGSVAVTGDVSPAQITGNQDNYAPTGHATAGVLRISTDARRTISGLAGGADGRLLTVHNVGTFPAVFAYENTNSDAENRFAFAVTLGGGQSMEMQYDATATRWRCKAKPEPLGTVKDFAGSTLPADFLALDQNVSRTTYAALFNEIGTAFGAGDGANTFGLYVGAGRALIAAGTGTITEEVTDADITTGTDSIAVDSNADKWVTGMLATWNVTGTPPTTNPANLLDNADTVYIVRTGATSIKLATTLENAQNGTVIDITAAGSGTFTLTHTLTARTHGERGGEEAHAESSTELLSHPHGINKFTTDGTYSGVRGSDTNPATTSNTNSAGGNAAANIMQPFAVVTRGIRYV